MLAASICEVCAASCGDLGPLGSECNRNPGARRVFQLATMRGEVSAQIGPRGAIAVLVPARHALYVFDSSGTAIGEFPSDSDTRKTISNPDIDRWGWKSESLWVYDRARERSVLISPQLNILRFVDAPYDRVQSLTSSPRFNRRRLRPLSLLTADISVAIRLAAPRGPGNGAEDTLIIADREGITTRVIGLLGRACVFRSNPATHSV
jgi:hypothetical protein